MTGTLSGKAAISGWSRSKLVTSIVCTSRRFGIDASPWIRSNPEMPESVAEQTTHSGRDDATNRKASNGSESVTLR